MDPIAATTLALVSAFFYGTSHIFAKLSVIHLHPIVVAGVFTLVNLAVAVPFGFASVPLEAYRWEGILSFAVMGIFGFAGLRVLMMMGIKLLGAGRNAPVSGIYPVFTVIGASLLFLEQPKLVVWVGTVLAVGGIIWMAYAQEEEDGKRRYFLLPVLQALFRTIGILAQKLGLLYMNAPMFSVAIGGLSGGGCLLAYGWMCREEEGFRKFHAKGIAYGVLLGLSNTLALYLFTLALARSQVSLLVPIISTSPLFTLILARVFLHDNMEQLGPHSVLGGLFVVLGTVLITLSQYG